MSRRFAKHCEGCLEKLAARFRTLANQYLCSECYKVFLETGQVPEPEVREPEAVTRW